MILSQDMLELLTDIAYILHTSASLQDMLTPLLGMKSLVTLDIHDIGYVDEEGPEIRFCEGHDSHTDNDCPIILILADIGPLVLPNLVALAVNNTQGPGRGWLQNLVTKAPGRVCT